MRLFRATRYIAILLFSLLLATGCTEGSLFFPDLDEDEEASVSTLTSGSAIGSGDTLPIQLSADASGEYTSLEIRILTPDGVEVHAETYGSVLLSEPVLPDLELPPLEEGSYIAELTLFSQQEEVAREKSLFFFTDARFAIHGITLYPPTSETDALVIAEAAISTSDPALDPYLRWRFDGSLLAEGSVSENGTTARIASGGETGVFTLTAELFPWTPPEVSGVAVDPPSAHSTDVVVRRQGQTNTDAEGLYLSYSFDGHSRAAGTALDAPDTAEGSFDWVGEGEPLLTLRDELFGYRIESGSSFHLDRSILPVVDDRLYPFEISLDFAPLSVPGGGTSLLGTGDGQRGVVFGVSGAGEPWVWLQNRNNSGVAQAPSVGLVSGEPTSFQIQFTPLGEETRVGFYAGGVLLHEETLTIDLGGASDESYGGASSLGGTSATDEGLGRDSEIVTESVPEENPFEGEVEESNPAAEESVPPSLPDTYEEWRSTVGSSVSVSPGSVVVLEELSIALTTSSGRDALESWVDVSSVDDSSVDVTGADVPGADVSSTEGFEPAPDFGQELLDGEELDAPLRDEADAAAAPEAGRDSAPTDVEDSFAAQDDYQAGTEESALNPEGEESEFTSRVGDVTDNPDHELPGLNAGERESDPPAPLSERRAVRAGASGGDSNENQRRRPDIGDRRSGEAFGNGTGFTEVEEAETGIAGDEDDPDGETGNTNPESGEARTEQARLERNRDDPEESEEVTSDYALDAGEELRMPIPDPGTSVAYGFESYGPGAGVFLIAERASGRQELKYLPTGATLRISSTSEGATYAIDDGEDEPLVGEGIIFRNPYSGSSLTITRIGGDI